MNIRSVRKSAAKQAVKNRAIRSYLIWFIKTKCNHGTDLFDDLDTDKLPKRLQKFFENGGRDIETDSDQEKFWRDQKKDPEIECLYSDEGVMALISALLER